MITWTWGFCTTTKKMDPAYSQGIFAMRLSPSQSILTFPPQAQRWSKNFKLYNHDNLLKLVCMHFEKKICKVSKSLKRDWLGKEAKRINIPFGTNCNKVSFSSPLSWAPVKSSENKNSHGIISDFGMIFQVHTPWQAYVCVLQEIFNAQTVRLPKSSSENWTNELMTSQGNKNENLPWVWKRLFHCKVRSMGVDWTFPIWSERSATN